MTRPGILFVCSKNQWRSPTAEAIYRNDDRVSVRSRGTARTAVQTIRASDIVWADAILVMEDKHRQRIQGVVAYDGQSYPWPEIEEIKVEGRGFD